MRSDSVKNMSAYADQNHAPSLTDVRLENIIQQDNKKIIINETVYNYLSEFKSKIDINLTLKKNSNNCIERKKILKKFYENMCKLEIIVPFDRNNKTDRKACRTPFWYQDSPF